MILWLLIFQPISKEFSTASGLYVQEDLCITSASPQGEKKKLNFFFFKSPACKEWNFEKHYRPHLYLRCIADVFIFADNLIAVLIQGREHFFFPPKKPTFCILPWDQNWATSSFQNNYLYIVWPN